MEKMKIWNLGKNVPEEACKKILGGRLKGFTDINPMWRFEKLTEFFGACGIGWKVVCKKKWTEKGTAGQVLAFVDVDLFIKDGDKWSDAIEGTGGSMMITMESKGLKDSDECFKMAETDAISVCCKKLGIGADIYNNLPATKYGDNAPNPQPIDKPKKPMKSLRDEEIESAMKDAGVDRNGLVKIISDNFAKKYGELTDTEKDSLVKILEGMKK